MRQLIYFYYAAIAAATLAFLALFVPDQSRPTATECGVAEISPDMSTRDREVCRQLRRHRL